MSSLLCSTTNTAMAPAIPAAATATIGSHERRGARIISVGRALDAWLWAVAGAPPADSICAGYPPLTRAAPATPPYAP